MMIFDSSKLRCLYLLIVSSGMSRRCVPRVFLSQHPPTEAAATAAATARWSEHSAQTAEMRCLCVLPDRLCSPNSIPLIASSPPSLFYPSTVTLSSLDEKPLVPASASSKELSTLCDPLVNPSSTSKAIAHLTPFAFAGTDHFDTGMCVVRLWQAAP